VAVSFIGGENRSARRKPQTLKGCLGSIWKCLPILHDHFSTILVEVTRDDINISKFSTSITINGIDDIRLRVPHVEQELLTIPEHQNFSGVRVA